MKEMQVDKIKGREGKSKKKDVGGGGSKYGKDGGRGRVEDNKAK